MSGSEPEQSLRFPDRGLPLDRIRISLCNAGGVPLAELFEGFLRTRNPISRIDAASALAWLVASEQVQLLSPSPGLLCAVYDRPCLQAARSSATRCQNCKTQRCPVYGTLSSARLVTVVKECVMDRISIGAGRTLCEVVLGIEERLGPLPSEILAESIAALIAEGCLHRRFESVVTAGACDRASVMLEMGPINRCPRCSGAVRALNWSRRRRAAPRQAGQVAAAQGSLTDSREDSRDPEGK